MEVKERGKGRGFSLDEEGRNNPRSFASFASGLKKERDKRAGFT